MLLWLDLEHNGAQGFYDVSQGLESQKFIIHHL